MTADPVLLVTEVADELRCDRRTVTRLCMSGELRAFRVGQSWRVTRSALEAYKSGSAAA